MVSGDIDNSFAMSLYHLDNFVAKLPQLAGVSWGVADSTINEAFVSGPRVG
jgi:hypothetical protein